MVVSPFHDATLDTYVGELGDLAALTDAMRGCDAVMHLAAVADVSQVALDPVFAEQVNARGTLHVLQAARDADVRRVIYASTIWVYNGLVGNVDETVTLPLPTHLYTATKIAGEMYCTSYGELYGVQSTILRFGIPYGPRARPAAVLPQFVRRALAGEPLTVAGAGDQSRRFVYVEDLAQGCVAALAPVAANRVYNLVGDETVTVKQIASIVQELIGNVDILHVESRAGDFSGTEVSGDRAARELGWMATTPFTEGVRRYIDWLRGPEVPALNADAGEPDPVG
jgi:UDP-glucose 4-epimerase